MAVREAVLREAGRTHCGQRSGRAVGGLDQGVVIPSLSWLVGVRASDGTEIGVGPNITPAGVALALAAGKTFRAGVLNVPVNIAVVPSRLGMRVSLLTGFSLRH